MPILPNLLAPGLRAVFVGTAAGDVSAVRGHYYAGPGNDFWRYLYEAGLTDERLAPERDREILRFRLGLTDLAKRRSASTDALLAQSDFDVPAFVSKVARYEPGWVAFHGKRAATEVARSLGHGRTIQLGPQDWMIADARVFALPSASASNRIPARFEGKPSRLAWFTELRKALDRGAAKPP